MKFPSFSIVIVIVIVLSGCASQSSNMRVGTDQSYLSLKDQREAVLTVKEFTSIPDGALVLGPVDASRCHRNTLEAEPGEVSLKSDLKVAAYARGADGIMDIKITKEAGLLKNCWYIFNASATMVTLKK